MNEKTYCKYCNKETYSIPNGELMTCLECGQIKYSETRKRKADIENLQEQLLNNTRQNNQSTLPKCPNCGSTAIQPVQRGYSLLSGFIGSGKTLNYCINCGHKWDPKKK